jgi:hypothetical protein
VTDAVLAEAWTAMRYHYEVGADELRAQLRAMLTRGPIEMEPGSGALEALQTRTGAAGLVDDDVRPNRFECRRAGSDVRLISARPATAQERHDYEEGTAT